MHVLPIVPNTPAGSSQQLGSSARDAMAERQAAAAAQLAGAVAHGSLLEIGQAKCGCMTSEFTICAHDVSLLGLESTLRASVGVS